MKIWKKIIIGIFLGTIVFAAMPVIGGNISSDDGDSTHYSQYTAYAVDAEEEPKDAVTKTSEKAKEFQETMIEVASSTQQLLNYLLWPVLVMIGGLLDNSILFSNGMEERLREIWINIRNIVNIFFVLIMLGVAIYNVLGIGEEGSNYSIKTMLPRLIIGIIAVNFSFLAIKITLDLVNVLTVSVFAITDEVGAATVGSYFGSATEESEKRTELFCHSFNGMTPKEWKDLGPVEYKKKVDDKLLMSIIDKHIAKASPPIVLDKTDTTVAKKEAKLKDGNPNQYAVYEKERDNAIKNKICEGVGLTKYGQDFLDKWGSQNAALALAVNMTDMVFYQGIPVQTDTVEKLAINGLFSMLMYMMYATAFIALFVVLLGRLVFMWIAIAMSPVITLFLVVPGIKEQLGEAGKHIDEFVKQAIAPVIIAVVLTIGWIMLSAIKNTNVWNASMPLPETGFPVVGLGTLQDLIVSIGTVAIVWLGAKAATGSLITAKVTDSIFGAAEGALKFITEKPLRHADWIPITVRGKRENYSMDEVITAGRSAENQFSNSDQLWKDISGEKSVPKDWLKENALGTDPEANSNNVGRWLKTKANKGKHVDPGTIGELKEYASDPAGKAAVVAAFKKLGIKGEHGDYRKAADQYIKEGKVDGMKPEELKAAFSRHTGDVIDTKSTPGEETPGADKKKKGKTKKRGEATTETTDATELAAKPTKVEIKSDDKIGGVSMVNGKIGDVTDNLKDIEANLENKTKLPELVKKLEGNYTGQLKAEDVTAFLKAKLPKYQELEKAHGGEAGLTAAIEAAIGPPPAAPPAE